MPDIVIDAVYEDKVTSEYSGMADRVSEENEKIVRSQKRVQKQNKNTSFSFKKLKSGYTAVAAILGGVFVGSTIRAATGMQAINNGVKAAVDGFADYGDAIKFVNDLSDKLGLNVVSTGKTFKAFAAASLRSGMSMKEVEDVFTGVAEATVAMRLPAETQQRAFTALSQMASKGTVSMEELSQQLGETLPGALQIGAEAMGMTSEEFIKMVSQGKLAASDFLPKFGKAMKKNFGDASKEGAKSLSASMERVSNSFTRIGADMGNQLVPAIKVFSEIMAKASDFVKKHNPFARLVDAIGIAKNGLELGVNTLFTIITGFLKKVLQTTNKFLNFLPDRLVPKSWTEGLDKAAEYFDNSMLLFASAGAENIDKINGSLNRIVTNSYKAGDALGDIDLSKLNQDGDGGDGGGGGSDGGGSDGGDGGDSGDAVSKEAERQRAILEAKRMYAMLGMSEEEQRREERINSLKDEFAERMQIIGENYEAQIMLASIYDKKLESINQDYHDREMARHRAELKMAERKFANNLSVGQNTFNSLVDLNKKILENDKNSAKKMQAVSIAQAVINGALAITKTFAQMGPIAGAIASVGVAATTAAQVATIASQKFAKGGDFVTNGRQLIEVGDNPGGRERVQITPLSSPNINGPKEGLSVDMSVTINGTADESTVAAIEEGRERQLEQLKEDLRTLSYQGVSFA